MATADFTVAPTIRIAAPKPRMTVYYALLIIALLAMLTACLFMYLEIRRFGGFGAVKGTVKAASVERPMHAVLADARKANDQQIDLGTLTKPLLEQNDQCG
jgi:uncharacterized membrane protein